MQAEILSIGSELTSGQNLDTNSQWLSRRLAECGIVVGWHTTVADDLAANVAALRIAASRAKLIIATGGLGPTQDDLTREALAQLTGTALVLDQQSLDHIGQMFARRGRTMPERNRVQAYLPAGAESVRNDFGTAPGVWMEYLGSIIVALPGVPSEMHGMFQQQVQARLARLGLTGGVVVERKINAFGSGESAVEEKLLDLTRRGHVPEVGITVSDAVISLRIVARAADRAAADKQIAPIEQLIRDRLGELVFGAGDQEMQEVVAELLDTRKASVATAESITAGLVAHRLGQVPGISRWLRGGIIAYTSPMKTKLLGVPAALIERCGAVSAEVAEAMAMGARDRFDSDFGISTTGIAGPSSDEGGLPIGTVFVGLAWSGGVATQQFSWGGTRTEIQSRTAKLALNRLRLHLLRGEV
jgi:nicotinamide-nucleotide amidase